MIMRRTPRMVAPAVLSGLALTGCMAIDPWPVADTKRSFAMDARPAVMSGHRPRPAMAGSPTTGDPAAPHRLTLEGAVRQAVIFSPAIRESRGRLAQQEEQIDVALAGYRPRVQGGLTSGLDSDDGNEFSPKAKLSASQMIFDFGKVSGAVEYTRAGRQIRSAQLSVETDGVIKDTADALIEVQRSRALIKAGADQIAGLTEIGNLVKQRVEKGGSSRSDEVQVEARIQAAQATLIQNHARRARWEATLGHLIGGGDASKVTPEVPGWLKDACNTAPSTPDIVPRVVLAGAEHKQALAQIRQTRAEALPTVSLQGGADYDLIGQDARDPLRYNIGLSTTGNLYEGGAAAARRRAASYQETTARSAIDTARMEVGQELAQNRGEADGLEQLLPTFAVRKKLGIETRDLYQRQYLDLGTKSLLDLLNAELELHAVEVEHVNAEHDLRKLGVSCIFNAGLARSSFGIEGRAAMPDMAGSAKDDG